MRLLPGRRCTVAWPLVTDTRSATGTVVRSAVGRVTNDGVVYHVAVAFDDRIEFLREVATPVG
jgi:hypothetical protein